MIDAYALKANHRQWGGACVSVLRDIDAAPTVAAVPLDALCAWLGRNYEPPYGNRTPSWPIDEHEQADIWREFLEGFMGKGSAV